MTLISCACEFVANTFHLARRLYLRLYVKCEIHRHTVASVCMKVLEVSVFVCVRFYVCVCVLFRIDIGLKYKCSIASVALC